ncbi:MAG TPA: hypothetical protein VLC92_18410 [Rhodocyclaceae bacterium]|nr:hypothetical protein [Rhodocyclaceae bacterium]
MCLCQRWGGSKAKPDRFIAAMTSIHEEIRRIERGELGTENNPQKTAPHTQGNLINLFCVCAPVGDDA